MEDATEALFGGGGGGDAGGGPRRATTTRGRRRGDSRDTGAPTMEDATEGLFGGGGEARGHGAAVAAGTSPVCRPCWTQRRRCSGTATATPAAASRSWPEVRGSAPGSTSSAGSAAVSHSGWT
ncbi:hypothetical protein ACP4OV_018982 [Aristida adscensionis]